MKTSPTFMPTLCGLLALTAAVFALLEYGNYADMSGRYDAQVATIKQARELAARHSDVFGPTRKAERVDLKTLVQAASAKHGVVLVYLNETDQAAGENGREINVVTRAVNVAHDKLVLFLAEVETGAGGARFKTLRLRPKAGSGNEYDEAEAVLSLRIEKQKAAATGTGTPPV